MYKVLQLNMNLVYTIINLIVLFLLLRHFLIKPVSDIKGATLESAAIVEKARLEAKTEYDRIVSEAGSKAGDLLEAAKENVRIEREKTMKDLQTQIAGLAMASAEKIVGDKEQNIYDQFLGEVGGTDENTDK